MPELSDSRAAASPRLSVGARILAPAKVNLSLRVRGVRSDGYHEIESLFVAVSLYDILSVLDFRPLGPEAATKIQVVTDRADVPDGVANLAHRAAASFAEASGRRFALSLRVEKRIPAGAGLGGGSSDAAAVLLALNASFGRPLSAKELLATAAALGADVPFFLGASPAWVRGIGERLDPYAGPVPLHLVLCGDGRVLSTRDVFAMYDASLTIGGVESSLADPAGADGVLAEFGNDLEHAAIRLHPGILAVKRELSRRGASKVMMTGSGSVVFGVVATREEAVRLASDLRTVGFWAEAVRSLERPAPVEMRSGR